jgi:hypothetical protein
MTVVLVLVAAMTMSVLRFKRRRKEERHQGDEWDTEKGFHGAGIS